MNESTPSLLNKAVHRIIRNIHSITPHNITIGNISFNINYVEYGSTLDKSVHKYGNYEPWLGMKIIETLNKDDIVCDIGAHHGYYSMLLNGIVSSPRNIYSFEPDTANTKLLRKNISNTTVIEKCVSDVDDDNNVSLDVFFEKNPGYKKPTALKIDVDGAEIKLIKGAVKLIEENRPKIFMEVHPIQIEKYEEKGIETMFDILFSHYRVMFMLNHWGKVKGYDEWEGKSTHEWEEADRDRLVRYCHDIIDDNINRRAAIYNNKIMPRGFAIYCS